MVMSSCVDDERFWLRAMALSSRLTTTWKRQQRQPKSCGKQNSINKTTCPEPGHGHMIIFTLLFFSSAFGDLREERTLSGDNEENLRRCRAFGDFGAKLQIFEEENCQVLPKGFSRVRFSSVIVDFWLEKWPKFVFFGHNQENGDFFWI